MTSDGKAFEITAVTTGTPLYIPIHPDRIGFQTALRYFHLPDRVAGKTYERAPDIVVFPLHRADTKPLRP
jgi:hypothetical protein